MTAAPRDVSDAGPANAGRSRWLGQLRSQVGFDLLAFRRNPAATFFTVIMPLIFLVIFTSIFGNEELDSGRRVATFYVPGILTLAIVSATFVNLAMTITTKRERGVLKRIRATPLRPQIFIGSQAVAGMAISLVMTVLLIAVGWVVFDVTVLAKGVPSLVISTIIGAASFAAMGLALSPFIPSEDAAPAMTNVIVLPLYFISDVFIVSDGDLGVLSTIGSLFPIKHLASALNESFDPFATATPWPWDHWLVVAAWGAVGAIVMLKRFRWTPRR